LDKYNLNSLIQSFSLWRKDYVKQKTGIDLKPIPVVFIKKEFIILP